MKNIVINLLTILLSFTSSACEICGCGVGNYYIGLLPQFSRSFIGIRYQFSSFHTSIKEDPTQYSKDLFQTIEVWGGMNIGNRWQVLALVPFNIIHQASDDGTFNSNGIGDIAVIGNYKVFNLSSATAAKKLITQQLWLGAGIKLSTGKFNININDPTLIALANTQVGSGSTDFMLNAMYDININRFGLSTSARYKINTTNHDQYFFGNKFSAISIAYYAFTKAKTTITPNAGLMYDHSEPNKSTNRKIAETGGYLLNSVAGVEVNFNKITIGCNAQLPLTQNFASAQTKTKVKGMLHVTFSL
ncbi:MAG: hypothetical protein ABI760_15300 [Ferruginibacter sp.]